jgi:hypothetical protein
MRSMPFSLRVLFLTALIATSTQTLSRSEELTARPSFDWAASPLSEVEFLNETTSWFQPSHRFPGSTSFQKRQEALDAMARQRFQPAISAVAVFDFVNGRAKVDRAGFLDLLRAARAGDRSSQCALYPIYFLSTKSFPDANRAEIFVPLLESGALSSHVACQFYLGVFLAEGREGLVPDPARAERLLVAAALQGAVGAQSYLAFRIGSGRTDDLQKAEEALCWIAATYRHSPFEGTDVFANGLRMKAMEAQAADGSGELLKSVDALIDRWLVSRNPARPRDVDPRQCVNFRSQR